MHSALFYAEWEPAELVRSTELAEENDGTLALLLSWTNENAIRSGSLRRQRNPRDLSLNSARARLWSYPCVYQDKGVSQTGEGKELCDLLVVFENHILIFSDKHCVFPSTGNSELDWSRWYRRSVLAAEKQLRGAERWIKDHPDRIFVDRACKQRFPVSIPSFADAKYHLLVVAHGSVQRTRQALGGATLGAVAVALTEAGAAIIFAFALTKTRRV